MGQIQRKLKSCKTCSVASFLWSHGNCKKCASKNNTKAKLNSIAPMSEKRKREQKVYSTIRKIFLANHDQCEAKLVGCTFNATDVHHKKGRVGSLYLNVKHFLAVCRHCHHYIETHPLESKELGLSQSRLKTAKQKL